MTGLRSHPGMRRLEIGIRGFFENGGQTAFVTLAFVESGKDVSNKRKFLEDSFDGISPSRCSRPRASTSRGRTRSSSTPAPPAAAICSPCSRRPGTSSPRTRAT
jgi:hypothetical protein